VCELAAGGHCVCELAAGGHCNTVISVSWLLVDTVIL
jgi:hypothetical protein